MRVNQYRIFFFNVFSRSSRVDVSGQLQAFPLNFESSFSARLSFQDSMFFIRISHHSISLIKPLKNLGVKIYLRCTPLA